MAELILLVVIGTTIWTVADARTTDPQNTVWWGLGCLLLWIVVFPWYLVKRSQWRHA